MFARLLDRHALGFARTVQIRVRLGRQRHRPHVLLEEVIDTLLYLDLDHLSADALGNHLVIGDEFVCEVLQILELAVRDRELQSALRPQGHLGRLHVSDA